MEDVVVHYRSGSAEVLSSLLQRTEKLLEPFTCRTPPVFAPWFPPSPSDCQVPLRPAKPAPSIVSVDGFLTVTKAGTENRPQSQRAETTSDSRATDGLWVSEPPNNVVSKREVATPPQTDKDGPPLRRSWSVFIQRGVLLPSLQSPSKRFGHMVSSHRLHPHQRAKWTITGQNCRDIEKVWCSLTRSVRSSRLPTCNANIQRERAEIWVFCDVLYSEQVGRFLKEELQLSGAISLSVHRQGNVFSM
ncbi:shieldin complex subunit 3 [Xenentodon cancila]